MTLRHRLPGIGVLLVLALLFLLPVLAFSELLFKDMTLFFRDIVMIHYPLGIFKGDLLAAGQIPLWNPYIEFGFPQLADQDVIALNPLNLLFLLPLKPHLALSWFIVAHFILAGVAGYAMARGLRMSKVGALITAMAFALGGYMMAQLTNLPIMTGSVWLPLVFLLFVKALQSRSLAYAILCGAAIAIQVFASHPQVVFYTLLLLAAYGAFWLLGVWRDREIGSREKAKTTTILLSLMAVTVVSGLLLAAIQILPTWELKALSPRATGLSYAMMTVFSLPPYNPVTLLFVGILGNPVIGYTGEGLFEELHVYVGIVPLMLVPWAWSRRKPDRNVAFFAILAGVSLLLAFGHYTPLYRLLVHVPGFNFFRVPARWLLTFTFSLSVLAGYGYDLLVQGREERVTHGFAHFWQILASLNVVLSLLLLAGLAFGQQTIHRLDPAAIGIFSEHTMGRILVLLRGLTRQPLVQSSGTLGATLSSLNPTLLYVLFSNAGFLVIHLWNRRRINPPLFQVLLVGLVAVDLLVAGGTAVNPVRDAAYFEDRTGTVDFLQQNAGLHRIFSFAEGDNVQNLLEDMPVAYALYSAQGHVSQLALQRYEVFLGLLYESDKLLDLAGVKYALVAKGAGMPGRTRVYAGGDPVIYENGSVLPRAFIVHEAEVLPSEQAVLERLLSDDFDPARAVILEREPGPIPEQSRAMPAPLPAAVPSASQGRADGAYLPFAARDWPALPQITAYSPHRVVIQAGLPAPGFLVLTDTNYPGWQALVDGQETEIFQADYLFRAVPLPPGQHTVEFRYSPPSFRTGLVVTLVAGAIFSGLALFSTVVRRRATPQTLSRDV
jgi:hypothetical protein